MFKWRNPWAPRASAPKSPPPGWNSVPSQSSLTSAVQDLASWGFEVTSSGAGAEGDIIRILHGDSGRGLEISGSYLNERLMDIYWGIRAGRDSAAAVAPSTADLAAAQRGRQVAIDLLGAYIEAEFAKVEASRAATMRQVIAHGQVHSQEAHMVVRLNMMDDVLCKLRGILEEVKSA